MAFDTPIPRPAVLDKGLLLCAAVAVVGFLSSFVTQGMIRSAMVSQGLPQEAVQASGGGMGMSIMALISLALAALCLFFIAKGKNVARVIWLLLVAFGVLGWLMSMGMLFNLSVLIGLFSLLLQAGTVAGTVLIWLKPVATGLKR